MPIIEAGKIMNNMSKYSDIVSDGGLDPRNEYEKERKSHNMNEAAERIKSLIDIQKHNGNYNYDEFMYGVLIILTLDLTFVF